MKEPWIEKLRSFMANPWPRKRETTVATWWEWRCHTYRLRQAANGSADAGDTWEHPYDGLHGDYDHADVAPSIDVEPAPDEKPKVALWDAKGKPLRYFAKRPIGYRSTKGDRP